jgi:hypothetical protein
MGALCFGWFHLDHDIGAVVSKIEAVFFVETDSDDVAVPTDSFVVVATVELLNCLLWVVQEGLVATVIAEVFPLNVRYWL